MFRNLKKICALFATFYITMSIGNSQDLSQLVPEKSMVSVMIDLKKIDSKANIYELMNLPLFKNMNSNLAGKILGDLAIKDSVNILDLKKIGINTENRSWFYVCKNKELYYGALLFAVADESVLTQFIDKYFRTGDGIMNSGSYKYIYAKKMNVVWNSNVIAFYGARINQGLQDSIQREFEPKISEDYYDNFMVDTAAVEETENYGLDDNSASDDAVVEDNVEITEDNQDSDSDSDFVYSDSEENTESVDSAYNYYNDVYNDPYMQSYSRAQEKCDSIVNFWCSTNASVFIERTGKKSVALNKPFMDYIKNNPDIAGIIDYSELMRMENYRYLSGFGEIGTFYNNFMKDYYNGLYLMGKAYLDRDNIHLRYDMTYSSKMKQLYKEVKKTSISKKFLRYLGNDIMAYAAAGIDIKGMSKGLGNVLRDFYPSVPRYGSIVESYMDIMDIFIDEEAIYNIFTGDVVVSLNGMKPVEVTHTVYDYDDNFNVTERLDTTVQMQPEVLLMVGIGNVSDVKKILKLLVSAEIFTLENGLYSLSYRSVKLPVFMKIIDEILFVSNNRSFVENPVIYAKNKQLGKEHLKMFKKNSGVVYVNVESIAREAVINELSKNDKILTKTGDLFKTVRITGGMTHDSAFGDCILQLSGSEGNSIESVLRFLNELYLFKTKRFD